MRSWPPQVHRLFRREARLRPRQAQPICSYADNSPRAASFSYVDKEGSSKQTACPAGRYTNTSRGWLQSACLPADPGSYVDKDGASEQKKCPEGEYSGRAPRNANPARRAPSPTKRGTVSCNPAEKGSFVAKDGASDDKGAIRASTRREQARSSLHRVCCRFVLGQVRCH